MAEQDRYGSHLGANPNNPVKDSPTINLQNLPKGDGGWFGRKAPSADQLNEKIQENLPRASGAEQDRLGGWFSGKGPSAEQINERLPKASGAEQDRYQRYFGDKPIPIEKINEKLPHTSGAEQDRYGGYFGGKPIPTPTDRIGSAAEQDRYASHFGRRPTNPIEATPGSSSWSTGNVGLGSEQERLGSHFSTRPNNPINATAVGLLQSTLLPSLGFHSGLSVIAYGVSRYTDKAEGKDWLWPSGLVANAWWSAIGTRVVYDNLSLSDAWSTITYPEKVLLTGVTAWGARLFYRVASRSIKRGKDDPRYTTEKQDPGFWNKALFTMFLPEAAVQALIALPFTLPFRAGVESAQASPLPEFAAVARGIAAFLFASGFALEVFADAQLESHKQKSSELNREGVWSIVRHPNYFGDALIHLSFPTLLYSAGILHPLAVMGPVANYVFLRFIAGDRQNEEYQEICYAKENPLKYQQLQEYKREKNSFWPSVKEVQNKWTWAVIAAGAGGVLLERGARFALRG